MYFINTYKRSKEMPPQGIKKNEFYVLCSELNNISNCFDFHQNGGLKQEFFPVQGFKSNYTPNLHEKKTNYFYCLDTALAQY